MRHPELPVAAFLSVPLVLCSLPSHIRAGSVSTMALIAWLAVVSIIRGVNALVWAGNVDLKIQVWCDITTKITIGFTYAVPASALCILRHLESVSSTRNVRITRSDKRRRQKFEAIMCFGLPIVGMALHYVVQGHRLDIIEDFGCYPPVYFSLAAIMILWIPPFVMSLGSFVYAGMALRHFLQRRIEFAAHLRNSQSAISPSHYFRLMTMAVVEMIWDSGVNAYLIYFNSFTGLRPWVSWGNVHSNFSRVAIFPRYIIPPAYLTQLIWQWWIVPISCVFFFVFFAFGEEARADYLDAIIWVRRTILRQKIGKSSPHGSPSVLPIHRPQDHIILPTPANEASEHGPKAWDDMSFKMPDILNHTMLPSGTDNYAPSYSTGADSEDHEGSASEHTRSTSLRASEHFVPPHSSQTLSSTTALRPGPLSPTYLHGVPNTSTTTETRPPSEASWTGGAVLEPSSVTTTVLSVPYRVPLSPISRPTSYRRSTSTDDEITVSPAYLSDAEMSSRHRDDAFFTSNDSALSHPGLPYAHMDGGIHLRVEKNVT